MPGRPGDPSPVEPDLMLTPSQQLGLPRRVVAFYLLFSLTAVTLLAFGSVVAVRSLLRSQKTDGALARVGKLSAAVQIDHLQTGGEKTQELLNSGQSEGRFSYCAVVDSQNRFTAHTNNALVGATVIEPVGTQLRWGAIDGVRYSDEHGNTISEYRSPIEIDGRNLGVLRLGVAEPGLAGVLTEYARFAPLAILAPLLSITAGGWWLRRLIRPLAGIDQQLGAIARSGYGERPDLSMVTPDGLAAVGWNRLADFFEQPLETTQASDLDERLGQRAQSAGDSRSLDALQSLADGVAVTDAEGRIDFANRAIVSLLGSDEPLTGASLEEAVAALSPAVAQSFREKGLAAQSVAEAPLVTAEGERTLRIARAPLSRHADSGHVWSVRDITQQKLAEASRDQFIDTATHELRTPLANIKAYAETLSMCDAGDVEQQKEFCNTINSEATRLARFVDDLLSISSLEVGSLGINRTNVDVRRLLEEAAEKVRPLMVSKSIEFEVSLGEKLGEASLDKDKIAGLVVNLLGNAVKYTPEGGTVTFAVAREDDGFKIVVQDTGVGISEEEQSKVFDKFFRSANPDVQDQVGTGLGLSLAREIARLHRGDLTLTSTLGEGTAFTALLPAN